MNCPQCNGVVPDNTGFCPYCGDRTQPLQPPMPTPPSAPATTSPRTPTSNASPTTTPTVRSGGMTRERKGYFLSLTGIILAVIIVAAFYQMAPRGEPYQMQLSTPQELIQAIDEINRTSTESCTDAHLNDQDWTCPQITERQASLIMARLIADHQTKAMAVNESEKDAIRFTIEETVLRMAQTTCLPQSDMDLKKESRLFALENAGFIERCQEGWTISNPWQEVVARQEPQARPEHWDFYYRHLPAEMLP